ncbi:GNAT family N-acetyltransferase [Sphingobacterium sp. SRCM116780]|uniref:GNAT family N-acetyltransferase n=1 Tax=Sphingobacterium sp. SRCM116780 TaxID=2907623 RepID=UPI001F24D4AF|nr:GNAT family N-acetyltransferase [Sphingobacterium sp. SRCM116780]UIR54661.1 GNAT family N-acetyltransferase [Sphingobacterium sp. SRCM116780]
MNKIEQMIHFSLQPHLENDKLRLVPLKEEDFEILYEVAKDPLVWEQHPNKDRYQRPVFQTFFEGALLSQGAYLIQEKQSGEILGSTRFYEYNEADKSIFIGYTFYGTKTWGKGINPQVKKMMLDYIFQFVDTVYFHVGKNNVRSQKAMERLGGRKIAEQEVAYHGEPNRINVVYEIRKTDHLPSTSKSSRH